MSDDSFLVGSRCAALEAIFGEPAYYFEGDGSQGPSAAGTAPGPLDGAGGWFGAHTPNIASEIRPNAEIITTDPERFVRKSERSDRV